MSDAAAARIVVMGPSASGKTVVGRALAASLGVPFEDADAFHAAASVAKMARGEPLGDDDRGPWLEALAARLRAAAALVLACSALGRDHRDALRVGGVRFVFLDAPAAVLRERLQQRDDHFAGEELLPSQLARLEAPGEDEVDVVTVASVGSIEEVVARALARLSGSA
ncbi:MAG: gluconokinase, GntK/IdnK-type [Myxococcota bacterium]